MSTPLTPSHRPQDESSPSLSAWAGAPRDDSSKIPADLPDDVEESYNPERTNQRMKALEITSPTFHPEIPAIISDSDSSRGPQSSSGEVPTPPRAPGFDLIKRVGRGGCGEVWEATQESLLRRVAIKRIRRDVLDLYEPDSHERDVLLRAFRHEALTSANLEHPNIVPVHELGTDASGEPLLAMKYVRGTPWNRQLKQDFATLPAEEHLAKHLPILLSVSLAVAFAHSRGILHRDIKPSQVMVGDFGEVLLVDWGLALPTGVRDVHSSGLHAAIERMPEQMSNPAGTPAYMAPEQTDIDSRRLGPWTDVYLLGGTLYYVLTGHPPHQGQTRDEVYLRAMQGIHRPAKDSAPGRHMPQELLDLAEAAMEADPEKRIRTAQEFGDRLRDTLTGAVRRRESRALVEDVAQKLAKGPSDYRELADSSAQLVRARLLWPENPDAAELRERVLDRFAKEALKHGDLMLAEVQAERKDNADEKIALVREIAIAREAARRQHATRRVAVFGVAILTALILASTMVFNHRLADQVESTEKALAKSDRARADAEALATFMLGDLKRRLVDLGGLEAMRDVANRSLDYFDNLPKDETETLERVLNRAKAYDQIADVGWRLDAVNDAIPVSDDAIKLTRASIEKSPGNAELHAALASFLRTRGVLAMEAGDKDGALSYYRQALAELDHALKLDPKLHLGVMTRTSYLDEIGVQATYNNRMEEARAALMESKAIREAEMAKDPATIDWRRGIVDDYRHLARIDEAEGKFKEAEAGYLLHIRELEKLVDERPDIYPWQEYLAGGYALLGHLYYASMRSPQLALEPFTKAVALSRRLADRSPADADAQRDLAGALGSMADLLLELGRVDEAIPLNKEAADVAGRQARRDPKNGPTAIYYGKALGRLGLSLKQKGDLAAAAVAFEQADEQHAKAVEFQPENADLRDSYSRLLNEHAEALAGLGSPDKAYALQLRALDEARRANELRGNLPDSRRRLAASLASLAQSQFDAGNWNEALRLNEEVASDSLALAREFPNEPAFRLTASERAREVTTVLRVIGRYEEALAKAREVLEMLPPPGEGDSLTSPLATARATAMRDLANCLTDTERFEEAEKVGRECAKNAEAMLAEMPDDFRRVRECTQTLAMLGRIQGEMGKYEAALETFARRADIFSGFYERYSPPPFTRIMLADCWIDMATAHERAGRDGDAAIFARKALDLALEIQQGVTGGVDPSAAMARANMMLGNVALRAGDRAKAREHFTAVIKVLDESPTSRGTTAAEELRKTATDSLAKASD